MQFAKDGGLFQSPLWKEFQAFQKKTLFEGENFFGVQETISGIGVSGYIPRGPVSISEDTLKSLSVIGREKKFIFLRVEPESEESVNLLKRQCTVVKAPFDVQPKEFLLVPINQTEEVLLANMKSKWRYNIRLAQKNKITVSVANSSEEETFFALMKATASRKKISFHKENYYRDFVTFFSQRGGELLIAKKDDVVLAGAMIVYWQDTAYYVHGGSSDDGKNFMAPHLLQWEAIRRAKAKGSTQYDFGGVAIQGPAPEGKDWQGITRFKQGFAPFVESTILPGTYDIIFSPTRYTFYKTLLVIRKMIKKYI